MRHGTNYNGTYAPPTTSQLKQAAKIAYFGWYQELGKYGSDGLLETAQLKKYALTQQYIWESLRTKFCYIYRFKYSSRIC